MTANPLKLAANDRPTAPQDEAERRRYWIDRGNSILWSEGRADLEWKCHNGSYYIDPRGGTHG